MTARKDRAQAPLTRVSPLRMLSLRQKQLRRDREMIAAFRSSPWPLYGLPPNVPCRRFIAGWGRSGKTTSRVELGHLPPDGSLDSQLRVEVGAIDDLDDGPEEYARGLWRRSHHEAWISSHPDGDLDSLRRHLDKAERDYETEAGITWEHVALIIDGGLVTFNQARLGDDWVALLQREPIFIAIHAYQWPDHAPELVTIEDLQPYIEGSERARREGFHMR
jgi:hypothetical protein